MQNKNEKTQEELQKEFETKAKERQAEYQAFIKELSDNPDQPLTNKTLLRAMDFIASDIEGIGQMAAIAGQNCQYLFSQFQSLIQMLQGGAPAPVKTKGGIILPGV